MTDYMFRYRLESRPTPTTDGSGMVMHDIRAVYLPQDSPTNEEWQGAPEVPSRHKTIAILHSDVSTVMDMPDSTGTQKTAKNQAYKDLLVANLNTLVQPLVGWDETSMHTMLHNNDSATLEALRVHDYIVNVLGQTYPIPFSV